MDPQGLNLQRHHNIDKDSAKSIISDPIIETIGTDYTYKHQIVWINAIAFLILHVAAIWGLLLALTGNVHWKSTMWGIGVSYFSSEGVTIGAHRLYAHKTFKAKPLLRAILMLGQTMAGQNSMFIWCRDHRLHHRYADTDGDPHNSKRGFFFCHIGWLMSKKHPLVIKLGAKIDMSDLRADWMVMLQKKFYPYLYLIFSVLIPVAVPVYCFGEPLLSSFLHCYVFRYTLQLNGTWLVNSAAHLYGTRPYDKTIQPVESWFVSLISLGEGWHNYHHTYPWDYKAAEFSMHFNQSATLIRFFERIGLANDLKYASSKMIENRAIRKGDGTHSKFGSDEAQKAVTAWGPLHPLNPTYTVTYKPPGASITIGGLPLYHEKDVLTAENSDRVRNRKSATA